MGQICKEGVKWRYIKIRDKEKSGERDEKEREEK